MSLSGTTQLTQIFSKISNENKEVDLEYLDYYVQLEDDTSLNLMMPFSISILKLVRHFR